MQLDKLLAGMGSITDADGKLTTRLDALENNKHKPAPGEPCSYRANFLTHSRQAYGRGIRWTIMCNG